MSVESVKIGDILLKVVLIARQRLLRASAFKAHVVQEIVNLHIVTPHLGFVNECTYFISFRQIFMRLFSQVLQNCCLSMKKTTPVPTTVRTL